MNHKVKYMTMVVYDMEESIKFYKEVLGFEIENQFEPEPGFLVTYFKGKGAGKIELIESSSLRIGFYSVGLDVKDMTTTMQDLKSKDVDIYLEPVQTMIGTMAIIRDPNGLKVALIQHNLEDRT